MRKREVRPPRATEFKMAARKTTKINILNKKSIFCVPQILKLLSKIKKIQHKNYDSFKVPQHSQGRTF
jgi:hypothetical protein